MHFESLRTRKEIFFCAVFFCLFSSGAVVAAEWSVEPSISLREEYNDNIRFTTSPHSGVWHTSLSPSVMLSSKTEVSEVSGLAQVNFNRFAGEPGLNQNDLVFSLVSSLQSERNTWAMNALYKQDSTSESERISTGVVQVRTQRTVRSLNPSLTRNLTERSSFKLDYNYQDVRYAAHINLNDYTLQQASGTLQYKLNERDQVSLAANYSITDYAPVPRLYPSVVPLYGYIGFDPAQPFLFATGLGGTDTLTQKINTSGVRVSATHLFSETLRGDLSAGYRTTVIEANHSCNGIPGYISPYTGTACTGSIAYPSYPLPITAIDFTSKSRGNGYSFSANLEKTFDAAKVSGFASRETNPSGSGLVETDKIGMSFNKSLTENLKGAVDAISYRTKYISLAYPSSRYYVLEPKLNWRIMERWKLDAGYRYAQFESDNVANATTANLVYFNLTYNWPKMAVSR